jgi:hypothetical protein
VAHEWAGAHLLIAGLVTEDVGLALDDALADAVELGNVPRLLVVAELLPEGPRDVQHPARREGRGAATSLRPRSAYGAATGGFRTRKRASADPPQRPDLLSADPPQAPLTFLLPPRLPPRPHKEGLKE